MRINWRAASRECKATPHLLDTDMMYHLPPPWLLVTFEHHREQPNENAAFGVSGLTLAANGFCSCLCVTESSLHAIFIRYSFSKLLNDKQVLRFAVFTAKMMIDDDDDLGFGAVWNRNLGLSFEEGDTMFLRNVAIYHRVLVVPSREEHNY
jgi:hypothetical protein